MRAYTKIPRGRELLVVLLGAAAAVAAVPALYAIQAGVDAALEGGVLPLVTGAFFSSSVLWYQMASLGFALLFLLFALLLDSRDVRSFMRAGEIDAQTQPAPLIGLKPKEGEGWRSTGTSFLVIISGVTALVIYLQSVHGRSIDPPSPSALGWILLFSLINSFNEETIFRFSLVPLLHGRLPKAAVTLVSGAVFGIAHYGGHPGGIPGVVLAGFLGWFLAKSLVETRGWFWAWLIHFVQDVVIFTGLFITLSQVT